LLLPLAQDFVRLGFALLTGAVLSLGVGDTWADWRNRAPSTPS
jgi:hypothetical protein